MLQISCADSLKIAAPEGIDCFFDNIGGSDSTVILNHMNPRGRIAVCGSISTYNDKEPPMAPVVQSAIVTRVRIVNRLREVAQF